jgi:hypothetical protein
MTALLDELARAKDARAAFHATYLRTTRAVAAALYAGAFLDGDWVERWDVAFAGLYLDALEASGAASRCRGHGPSPSPRRPASAACLPCAMCCSG